LGIVAGIVDAIGIVEIINDFLGEEVGEKVSAGQVVKAMIFYFLQIVFILKDRKESKHWQ
jgi:Domain of unknown function (DUF4277)